MHGSGSLIPKRSSPSSSKCRNATDTTDGPEVSEEPALSGNDGLANEREPTEFRYPRAIDKALLQVYQQHRRLALWLYPDGFRELTLDHLREGPLGRDLRRLAAYAQGQAYETVNRPSRQLTPCCRCCSGRLRPTDYWVPRFFWDTDLGRMLNRAKLRSYKPDELVSLGQAARPARCHHTDHLSLDGRSHLGWVRDDNNGRTWIVRREIEQLKRKATELVPRQTP